MPRSSTNSAPLTKTFHVYFSKLKRSIIKNSSSVLYDFTASRNNNISSTSLDFTSDNETNNPPDFATVFASQRFFFTSPGRSNSIVESKCTIIDEEDRSEDTFVMINGGIPIQTYSLDPFIDFRLSMQEMVEASDILDVRGDGHHHNGDYLQELLLCYLALNTENTHRFIVDAFVDLLISLVTASPPGDKCSPSRVSIDRCSTSRVSIDE